MNNLLKKYLFFLLFMLLAPSFALAQMSDDYFTADQLLRQQKFEQAYQKFEQLHHENPGAYLFLDKATECLVNLKKYEKAVSLVQKAIEKGSLRPQATILLGEVYHISGDSGRANSLWSEVLEEYKNNQQIYLSVARAMKKRGAFSQAIEVYKKAGADFSNSRVITSELAETYLQAGRFEKAIQQFLQLVKEQPGRMNFVQTRLIRLRNDAVYDTAIREISDFLEKLSTGHPSYKNLSQLQIWLMMERKLFEQALATAVEFESESSNTTYTLYSLGSKLLAEKKFGLAEKAYSYYIEKEVYSAKNRSMEELANVYLEWAKYLGHYNLGLSSNEDKLYQKAFSTLNSLRTEAPNYPRMGKVLLTLSELSLDALHKPQKARNYLSELRSLSDSSLAAQQHFIEGRLHLYDEDYSQARVSFTESKKQERGGSLAEKSRYYLALTDFYAGDYEFAKIQLSALERKNASYFANDAVQLRLWIQNGLQADSTGKFLDPLAGAVEHFSQGENREGIEELKPMLEAENYNPLADEALLELSRNKNFGNVLFVYQSLNNFLKTRGASSPLYERLLWERARIADQFVINRETAAAFAADSSASDSLTAESSFFAIDSSFTIPTTVEDILPLYEEILMHFPNGFYAAFARNRIQELQKIQS